LEFPHASKSDKEWSFISFRLLFTFDGLGFLDKILIYFDDRNPKTDSEISSAHVAWPSSRFVINLPPLLVGGTLAQCSVGNVICSAVHPTILYIEYELWIVIINGN
jgi:hypothetical protein